MDNRTSRIIIDGWFISRVPKDVNDAAGQVEIGILEAGKAVGSTVREESRLRQKETRLIRKGVGASGRRYMRELHTVIKTRRYVNWVW